MSGIIPIPTTRVGDLFVRQRLVAQVQEDQLALFRLQHQISTGRRIQLPSEDAPAALRAINVQRLLDRKDQIKTNIEASNQFLGSADAHLGNVSDALIKLRGEVVGVAGNTAPDSARQEVARSIDDILQGIVSAGNATLQGRYLFSGSRSQSQPYEFNGAFVEYSGNEGALRSYVDLERLFETNVSGTDVLGGVSAAVKGNVNLAPQVTADTLVSTLNGGGGIGRDPAITVSINNGVTTESNTIDLSGAVTVGDLARLIEDGAPAGADVSVEVTGAGLTLRVAGGDKISVSEVLEGHTAQRLGLLSDPDVPPTDEIIGLELNPAVLKTTRLSDLLGKKSVGRIQLPGSNNDIELTATSNGNEFDGAQVVFVGGGTAGSENVVYNQGTKTLTVTIQDGVSTAKQVIAAITAEGHFTAAIDFRDAPTSVQAGSGAVSLGGSPSLSFTDVTGGGSGETLDTASGLHLTNGGQSVALDISSAQTVEDLLNLINGAGIGLHAEINDGGTGINVRSRWSGADFMIGENGGTTAEQLGLRTLTSDTKLAGLNRGLGVPTSVDSARDDLVVVDSNGVSISINLSSASTVEDVISLINGDVDNPGTMLARLATNGNGIELVDSSGGSGALSVQTVEGSLAAQYLGFVAAGQTQSNPADVAIQGVNQVLKSQDRNTLETDSVFNTLLRLRGALESNNDVEIGRSLERLDSDLDRLNFARAEIGGRLQNLEVIGQRLADENVQLRSALSLDMDVDLVEAISQLTARQYAFEASLRSSASLMQMTLLNFL